MGIGAVPGALLRWQSGVQLGSHLGGSAGADLLDGGAGTDAVWYQASGAGVMGNVSTYARKESREPVPGQWYRPEALQSFHMLGLGCR